MGIENPQALREAKARTQKSFKLSAGLQDIEPAQGRHNTLAHPFSVPITLGDLKILSPTIAFDAEEHSGCLGTVRQHITTT
jgi:hypothetical protein